MIFATFARIIQQCTAQADGFVVFSVVTVIYSHVWLRYGFGRIISIIYRFEQY